MGNLNTWTKQTVSGCFRNTTVRRSLDESQATVLPQQTSQDFESGQASQLATDLQEQKLEVVDPGQTSQATVDSAKPPVWYLEHATKCMEAAQQMTSGSDCTTLNWNHWQCKHLAKQLETAIRNSGELFARFSSPDHKAECLDTLKLLYRLAKEVESFIQDNCCKDEIAWMQAAVTSASVPMRVCSLGYDLDLCTKLLRNSNKLGGAWLSFTNFESTSAGGTPHSPPGELSVHPRPLSTFVYCVKSMVSPVPESSPNFEGLGEAKLLAIMREKFLNSLLQSLILSSKSKSINEAQLATILLKRFKAIQAMSTVDSSQLSNPRLWEVEDKLGRLRRSNIVLGKGYSSFVRKATWLGAVEVAEKEFKVRNDRGDGPLQQRGIEGEISVLAQLSHPNIVTFLGYTTHQKSCSIVLELMDGDLRLLMQQKLQEDGTREAPFSISVACDIMLQVAEAVNYMHQNGVVHGNLKSTSILFKSSKDVDIEYVCVKVASFGLFQTKGRCVDPNATYGRDYDTSRWTAQELLGKLSGLQYHEFHASLLKSATSEADVYSYAMLCLEILTGNLAFSTIEDLIEVREKILGGHRPKLPSQCPPDLKNLIELCWNPVPDTRPSFAKICEELRYIKCSALLGTLGQDQKRPSVLPIQKALDLPGEVSKFKGDYSSLKVVRQLGRGGLDSVTVYLSTWRRTEHAPDQDTAQKAFIGSHDECFMNEVSIMANLNHPNVVRLLCYATDRRSCSIVMELMDADLYDLMHQRRMEHNTTTTGPFSRDNLEAVHVILQIAQGMEYVHGKEIVHRDLKSCNILVKNASESIGQMEVKVADFGLSVRVDSSGPPFKASRVGTVRWMAPEVMSLEEDGDDAHASLSNYDPFKSDVYSFGMLCYEILVGRVPFYNMEDLTQVKKKVLVGERPPLPDWTPGNLKALIEKCWLNEAIRRPSFSEVIEELKKSKV